MNVAGALAGGLSNTTRVFSPVTMNQEWPTLARLVFMIIAACIGSIINGFFVSSFFVEHTLKNIGNVFLACIGLSDLIVTTCVMPIVAVVLLSGEWDTLPVCYSLQFLTETSTYCYSMFFTLVTLETYYRLCRSSDDYQMFISIPIGLISVFVFIIGFSLAAVGVYHGLDYDYCARENHGNLIFRIATTAIFHGLPFFITILGLFASAIKVCRRASELAYYRRSQQYQRDSSTTHLSIIVYLLYVLSWIPYMVVVYVYPNTNDYRFYQCAWVGVIRCVFPGLFYSALNRNFRHAFAHLFYYCCCKSTLTGPFNSRHRRGQDYKPTYDVRVHIMHQVVNSHGGQRATAATRETQEL